MERFFILDKLNTWYDLHLILTDKDIPNAEVKTNLVKLDGMSGTLDLSETLTKEPTYNDRTIKAKFWTDYGNRNDRELLLKKLISTIHGKKIKIIEPDDTTHYFYGRVQIKNKINNLAYAEVTVEAICEPWRYSNEETVRRVEVANPKITNAVINNNGVKTLSPTVNVTGNITIYYDDNSISLNSGNYKISNLKLRQGVNIVGVSGYGSVLFSYVEAEI